MTEHLTPTRLFSDPPLMGGAPVDLKFAPDGRHLTYRRVAPDNRERMDLWRVDVTSGEHSLWIDARDISAHIGDLASLTPAERAERERRRQFSYGISQYIWHPDNRHLLLPMEGQAYLVDSTDRALSTTEICPADTRQSGFQISPLGRYVSYVRDGNLFVNQIAGGTEHQLTDDASATITNGLPDFLAAEEMHRFEGHWWSPDEQYLAFCKVDESPVEVSFRLEMEAHGARTIEQRYPFAGSDNPTVALWLYHFPTKTSELIWQDTPFEQSQPTTTQAYLARVHLCAGEVFIQTQDRRQQHLFMHRYVIEKNQWQEVYHEVADTWINLTNDFRVLADQRLLFTSEETGTNQARVVNTQGEIGTLPSPTHINAIVGVDDQHAYVTGWQHSPLENHLFAIDLNGGDCQQLTQVAGWHDVVVDTKTQKYIDRYSSETLPVKVEICALKGVDPEITVYEEVFKESHPYTPYLPLHGYPHFGEVTAEDGQTLYYRLTPPAEISGRHATIVYVYGGPGPQKARREWGTLLPQLFAHHGFAVLELDNRGTGNRGRTFEAPLYRQMGSIEVRDQVAALAVLDDYAWADKSRVGVFGHSYGGYMTLMCLSQANTHFHAGVAVAPVSDWLLYDTHYTERYMGLPAENPDGYQRSNVLTHLQNLRAPLLLMHGMADDNVLFTHSTLIMAALQKLGTPFELMTYPGAKHSMQERDVSIHRFNMILEFFTRRLGNTL